MQHVNMRTSVVYLILVSLLSIPEQSVSSPENKNEDNRPRVGLVLSGGGALGLAHIGVLQVLEELHVPVDCVVGTSMGALVGGIYATGIAPKRMQEVIEHSDIASLFNDRPPRTEIAQRLKWDNYRPLFDLEFGFNDGEFQLPSGASAGYKFELFLKELIGTGASVSNLNFDELPTPYRAVATDLETGEMKVFSHGDLPKAMRASMSLPAILAPTEIDGRFYIDGGMANNLPVDVGRNLCGDVLIAVNLGTKPKPIDEVRTTVGVAVQSLVLLTEQNVADSLKSLTSNDVLIVPDLEGFDSSGFSDKQSIIERGKAAALENEAMLAKLAISPAAYQRWLENRRIKERPALKITRITAKTTGVVNEKAILRDLTTAPGDDFDTVKLNNDMVEIYGRGDFSYVGYSILPDEGNATIEINADSKPWGPGYLKFGLGAATDFNSPTQLNLAASYRKTWINALGAVWRTDLQIGYDSFLTTEFFQPLQVRDGAFISPYIGARRHFIQFYDKQIHLGEFTVTRYQTGLNFGITGHIGELKIGPYISQIDSSPDFGGLTPLLPAENVTQKGLLLAGVYDQLDSLIFPRSGLHAAFNVMSVKEQESGDPDIDFTRAQAAVTGAGSFGRNTLSAHLEWGNEISGVDDVSIFNAFELGGPRRLSGLFLNQLTGSHYNLATLSYYYQYASLPPQIGRGLYVGSSIEAGRINDAFMEDPWDWVTSGSVFWGADTILGSAYIGYGISSLDQRTFYLVIGPSF